ncbi:MAG: apolipoprotein N-acyltransferase Int [Rhodobacteraceae bacterium HLUCCA12]|nr:MAG: apolipoprotein N-acyltransferase Int [Rhodobacteraceae bacterium HLUCCA12]
MLAVGRSRRPWAGFGLAWLAGFAGFGLALIWIVEPFFVDPDRHAWMAPFALILMAGGLALFWGLAGAFAAWGGSRPLARIWLFALAVLALEALRGHLFTGFPWAMLGHVWIGTPVAQIAAVSGALGLSALTLALSAGLATGWVRARHGRRWRAGLSGSLVVAVLAAGWGWGSARIAAPMPEASQVRLRVVQPNAPQALKWHPDHAQTFFDRHLDLTGAPAPDGRAPDMVIWSETSVPFFLDNATGGLDLAAEAADGAVLALGIQRRESAPGGPAAYFNSLAVLDNDGAVSAVYDKHHLVPFGEYVPLLGGLAGRPGFEWLSGFAARALTGYTPGPGARVLELGDLGRVLPLICYEAIFPRHSRAAQRPDWILQITNDAWFGDWIGPFQHLAQARLRAIEQGLPLVRAANTGVSAVIDARGGVVQALGMGRAGTLDADLPAALEPTPYARWGDGPWHIGLGLGIFAIAVSRWRQNRLTRRG